MRCPQIYTQMRKTIIFLLFSVCAFVANAQTPVSTFTNSTSAIVNAGSVNATKTVSRSYTTLTIQAVVTKVSGTVGGSAILQGSLDGTNYKSIGADTLTLANQTTNNHIWYLSPSKHYYYRVVYTGTGTMNATPVTYILGK